MSAPDGGTGYWIRYTTHRPIAGPAERRVWFARFDRHDPSRTFGVNASFGAVPDGPLFGDDRATFGDGVARGDMPGERDIRWDLRWAPGDESIRILPRAFYLGSVVPTRPDTPEPTPVIEGEVHVDGERVGIEGFSGHHGHVEGTRHGERWAWAQAAFEGGHAIQVLSAQGRRGPFHTPFLTFGLLRVGGSWVRVRGPRGRTWGLGTWAITLRSNDLRVEGRVTAPHRDLLRTRYLDPDGTPRWCHHTDVASSRFLVWERGQGGWDQRAELVSDGTTHAEWAGRTPAMAVEREHREVG